MVLILIFNHIVDEVGNMIKDYTQNTEEPLIKSVCAYCAADFSSDCTNSTQAG